MITPLVSIVIAAHGRVDALEQTIRSVKAQTMADWEALVVADGCSRDMLESIDRSDARVRLLSLPIRCGQQYGPNSVGIRAARGTHIAFLNHDDLWLPDHLSAGLLEMEKTGSNFWFSRAAFCHYAGQHEWSGRLNRLVFSEFNAPSALWRCLEGPNALFEPASSWIVEATLARRIGPWRPPGTAPRTPVMDWIAMAAHAGARFGFGGTTTVLKLNLHHPPHSDVPTYQMRDSLSGFLPGLMERPTEELRSEVDADVAMAPQRDGLLVRDVLRDPPTAAQAGEQSALRRFRDFLADPSAEQGASDPNDLQARRKAALDSITIRTGEQLTGFPAVDELWPPIEWPHAH